VSPAEIDAALDAAEAAVAGPKPVVLRGTGYWQVVAALKRDRVLADRYADRVGAIDQAAFRSWAPIVVPFWLGTILAVVGTIAALALVGLAYGAAEPWNGIAFLAGTFGLIVATHGLAHLVVGSVFGINFTLWFAGFRQPQPGIKTDYATYLRASARNRAWMHAAGAILTKSIPVLLIPSALIAGVPFWTVASLIVLGVAQVFTDVFWSVRVSDWSKYRREMAIAREE